MPDDVSVPGHLFKDDNEFNDKYNNGNNARDSAIPGSCRKGV
jgi:hypothetical protein